MSESPRDENLTDAQADALEARLEALAQKWRERLRDPALRREIKAGRVALSPLIKDLLKMFPPGSKRSTKG